MRRPRLPRLAPPQAEWRTLDRDLERMSLLEAGAMYLSRPLLGAGLSLVFIVLAMILAMAVTGRAPDTLLIVAAAALGAYMALNIGANDVANNMGPAVGAGALSMAGAIALAAAAETAGALIAGGDVIETVSRGIVLPPRIGETGYSLAMISALLGAALWVNLATFIGAPVSTTQAVVGSLVGAGIASAGVGAIGWQTLGAIAIGWVVSPLMGAVVAAALLALLKWAVLGRDDKIAAARAWLPGFLGVMACAFAAYLLMKAPPRFLVPGPGGVAVAAIGIGALAWLLAIPAVRRQSAGLENRRSALKPLFRMPLVCSAALLSFAHGANDVANAVGPLAALVQAGPATGWDGLVPLPLWVTAIGAGGISVGLMLFGPRLIRMVGTQITRLNPMRAFCVALSAAVTVILCSTLGLPVSSTHIAVGGVFGVGFFREWSSRAGPRRPDPARRFPVQERRRRRLVRRSHFLTIIAAWVVTLPVSALMAALICLLMRLVALPG